MVNLSNKPLDDSLRSALQKGLNFAISPTTLPIEDIITGVEKAVHSLPVETAEEIRHETVRIIKSSKRPKGNLTRAKRRAVKSVRTNGDFTILPFLDINIYRRPDGTLGHRVYRKPTHANLYLHPNSHHHPSNKHAVLATLVSRARAICDGDSLEQELEFLKNSLMKNYSLKLIQRFFSKKEKPPKENSKPISTTFLPYVQSMSGHLNRMLGKHNIRGINLPPKKILNCLQPVKDQVGLKGVYRIPCQCGKVYLGQSGRTVEKRVEEH